jgi:NAD dependent epimerase/dehydratase family enzyme
VIGGIRYVLATAALNGPVNVVAPSPATNAEFTKTLAKVLHRPAVFPMPAAVARLVLGEMADELLLASARVVPRKLESSGYAFQFRDLEAALRNALRIAV